MTPQDRKDIDRIRDNLVRGVPISQADALWLLDMVELLAWRLRSAGSKSLETKQPTKEEA